MDAEMKLLKSEEVARILQVSRSFAYQLMQRGEIPSVRIGNTVRVRPGDLQRYIDQKAMMGTSSQFISIK